MRFIECEYKNHVMDFHAKTEVTKWIKKFIKEKHDELQKKEDDRFNKSKAKANKRKIISQLPEPRIKSIKEHRLQIYSDYAEEWFVDELATFLEGMQLLTNVIIYEEDSEAVIKADDSVDLDFSLTETLSNSNFKCKINIQLDDKHTAKVPDTFCKLIQRITHEDNILEFDVIVNEAFLKIMERLLTIPLEEEKQNAHKDRTNMPIMLNVTVGVIESDYQLKFNHHYIPELNKDAEEPLFIRYVFTIMNHRTIKQDTDTK